VWAPVTKQTYLSPSGYWNRIGNWVKKSPCALIIEAYQAHFSSSQPSKVGSLLWSEGLSPWSTADCLFQFLLDAWWVFKLTKKTVEWGSPMPEDPLEE
jgi:hypothetical protein